MSFLRRTAWAILSTTIVLVSTLGAQTPPAATESDPRLHADGKGWRVDKAKVDDPKRPRVLLIGDSILNGYLKQVVKELEGKVYLDVPCWTT